MDFPPWIEVKGLSPELKLLWHHRNNLSVDDNGVIWRKMSSQSHTLQLLVPKRAREQLFLSYHASLFGGHLGQNRTLARLAHRFYWSGMSDDVKEWLGQCTVCIKRKSPAGHHLPLGNIPTGHRWDRIAMDILDVCDPTPARYRYILVIADYFSKWTEAFPIKNKCADTVEDVLVEKIILRFGMPLVIHSDQGREFENGLMKSLCALLGCAKTRTAPYRQSDGMIERFNRACLMTLSMFVNDRCDNWDELLPYVMDAYRTSVHESTGYSPFRLMMGWLVCWSLTSLCHSNGHIETMPAREINPFTALTRIRSQFLRTQWSTSNHQRVDMTTPQTAQPSGLARLMMGEECSLPQDVSTSKLRTNQEHDKSPHPFATWVRDALEVAYDHVRESLHRTAAWRKRLYDVKAVNRKFPVGSWVLRYNPTAAQHKLGSPWIGPNQVVRQATGHNYVLFYTRLPHIPPFICIFLGTVIWLTFYCPVVLLYSPILW